ncbi:MAG: magnesium transporter [Promethearchaeota archaeon]
MKTYTVNKIVHESLPVLFIVLIFSLSTGHIMDTRLAMVFPYFPFILLIIPAFINIAGDLSAVAGAHITSHLYTGELDERFRPYSLLLANLAAIFLVAITVYAFLGVCVIGLNYVIFPAFFGSPTTSSPIYIGPIFLAILLSGVMATICTSFIGLVGARIVYHSGRDPDSITPPFTTTIGDFLGTLFVTIALLSII